MGTVRTTITMSASLFEEVKREAQKRGMSVSKFIASSLHNFLIVQRKQRAAKRLLDIVKEKPLSSEAVSQAYRELKAAKREWEW